MAYLRVLRKRSGKRYLYIMRSVRKGTRVIPKVCEYLGRADQIDPKRLKRALEYWGVKANPEGREVMAGARRHETKGRQGDQ